MKNKVHFYVFMPSDEALSYGKVWVWDNGHDPLMINLGKISKPVQIVICVPVSSEIRMSFPPRTNQALITGGSLNLLQEEGRTPFLAFITFFREEGQEKVRMWPSCFCLFLKCQSVIFWWRWWCSHLVSV